MILLLGGCSLAPKYTKPEPPVTPDWPTGAAYGDRTSASATPRGVLDDWRVFFSSDQMRKVIALALANNRDLRVAALNIERAQALYRVQRAALFPQIDAGGGGLKERLPPVVSLAPQAFTVTEYNVNLGISSWEIDFFGRLRSLKASALEQYLATEEARRSVQIALVAEVADAYLNLAADRESLRLAQLTLDSQQASYDLIHGRFEAGISSDLDLRQAQIPLETARVDIARYTALVAQDVNALTLLVGAPVQDELLPAELAAVGTLQDVTPDLPSEALTRRPDILESEHQLKAMNANIGAARAAFFPRITLTTAIGTASSTFSGLFDSGKNGAWNFAGQASLPIFDAGANRANLKVADTDRDIAVAQYEKAIQSAFREVADALAEQKPVNDQLKAQQSLVDATAASHSLATARYIREVDSYLNVLDAERSLYSAQQGLIAVRLTRLTNMVRLYAALGGGA
jgi:multidrug efflux system outer membrane protein